MVVIGAVEEERNSDGAVSWLTNIDPIMLLLVNRTIGTGVGLGYKGAPVFN
jgi:hypothetical protein